MKKNNFILYTVLALASLFLLWLWYFLGFNHIDEPLDLVLSIIWWVIIVVSVITIVRLEKQRQERIRTVYVSEEEIFNYEVGTVKVNEPTQFLDAISSVIKNLKYGFKKNSFPQEEGFAPKYLIRTASIKGGEWNGKVVDVDTNQETRFNTKDELSRIIIK